MKTKHLIITLTAITALLLTACTTEKDPLAFCNNLDKQQVEQLLNSSYQTEPVSSLSEKAQGCKYTSATINSRTFNIIANKSDYPEQTQSAYQKAITVWQNSTLPNRTYTEVPNLGDAAFWSYNKKTPQLITYKETKLLIITLGNFNLDSDAQLKIATEIATTLFEKNW